MCQIILSISFLNGICCSLCSREHVFVHSRVYHQVLSRGGSDWLIPEFLILSLLGHASLYLKKKINIAGVVIYFLQGGGKDSSPSPKGQRAAWLLMTTSGAGVQGGSPGKKLPSPRFLGGGVSDPFLGKINTSRTQFLRYIKGIQVLGQDFIVFKANENVHDYKLF